MKTEQETAPSASPSQSNTQWAANQIPIDPALQQQPQTAPPYTHYGYGSHYPQATYPGHFQQYAPPGTQAQSVTMPRQNAQQSSSGMDTSDLATLNDALGSAGVDLRAEEETLQRSHEPHQAYRSFEDRTRKQPLNPSFDTRFLSPTMRSIGTKHKVSKIPDDSVNYLALALRARLQELITGMIAASHHRTDTQFDRPASLYDNGTPMWSIIVRSDVGKQLAALEKVEREEETKFRRVRREQAELAAAQQAAAEAQSGGLNAMAIDGGFDDSDGAPKKKRKKDGPGVTARNMSEDVRKKMSNAVASQAAGLGGKYAWMNAANAAPPAAKPKPAVSIPNPTGGSTAGVGNPPSSASAGPGGAGTWARPYVSTKKPSSTSTQPQEEDTRTAITLRDAIFVIEKERGHGGGRGAALGWV